MVKPRSKTASKKIVTKKEANFLADQLSDKPYGSITGEREYKRLTISMDESIFYALDELSRKRKKEKVEPKSMSAIANIAIEEYIIKHNT